MSATKELVFRAVTNAIGEMLMTMAFTPDADMLERERTLAIDDEIFMFNFDKDVYHNNFISVEAKTYCESGHTELMRVNTNFIPTYNILDSIATYIYGYLSDMPY